MSSIKSKLSSRVSGFMAALLIAQPVLDVLSYFMIEYGSTTVTTALRMLMLALVAAYAFTISDRKRVYLIACGAMLLFWLLHAANCLRIGYSDPAGDAAEYIKLIQYPLWTLCFMTFFNKRDKLELDIIYVAAVNIGIIILVIALSYLCGMPVYTYSHPQRGAYYGILGWFAIGNAQSAILCFLCALAILWGIRKERLWLSALCDFCGLGLLYFTGTKLAFYTAIIFSAAFALLIIVCRRPKRLCLPLLLALALIIGFKWASPMESEKALLKTSSTVYTEKIEAIMGEDSGFAYTEGEEISEETLEKTERVYTDIYSEKGVYGETLWGDLIERFGLERVLEKTNYSVSAGVLNNARTKKLTALKLVLDEQDTLTRLLGVEYSSLCIGSMNFDPENDFPALVGYYGYLGAVLYCLPIVLAAGYAVFRFIRCFPHLMTPEFICAAMLCVLSIGAAQLCGQFLRRPNVTVYFSLATAQLLTLAKKAPAAKNMKGIRTEVRRSTNEAD